MDDSLSAQLCGHLAAKLKDQVDEFVNEWNNVEPLVETVGRYFQRVATDDKSPENGFYLSTLGREDKDSRARYHLPSIQFTLLDDCEELFSSPKIGLLEICNSLLTASGGCPRSELDQLLALEGLTARLRTEFEQRNGYAATPEAVSAALGREYRGWVEGEEV